jgi:uncharacterized protein (DUF1501 family)
VVFTTEFGRSPGSEGATGRGHYNRAFSSWLAGGGVKGGITYGKTDEFGAKIVENECHVHDFHATILHCLGLNNRDLFLDRHGLKERLTDQFPARVVSEILA